MQLPPWQKGVMFLVELVCSSVCLWTTLLKKLWMDCAEILWRGLEWYNEELITFWWWCWSSKMSKWEKKTIIAVAWPDRGAGNDLEPLGIAFYHQGNAMHSRGIVTLLQPGNFTSLYTHDTVDNTGVMICFGQGGLRSLGALSLVSNRWHCSTQKVLTCPTFTCNTFQFTNFAVINWSLMLTDYNNLILPRYWI